MSTGYLLRIDPLELKFTFQLKKQISCSLQLTNKTDEYVAFKVKTTNPKKYCVRPNTGVVLPRSTCDVIVTMQAQKEAPPDMQCKDKFLLQCVKVNDGVSPKDITAEMFNKESGHVVEESKLRVVYVSPPQPPSPVAEGSEEGSSPRGSVSENGNVNVSDSATIARGFTERHEATDKSAEAKALITRLTEEKSNAIQQTNKLRQELDLLRRESNKNRGGVSMLIVILVGLLGIVMGYLMKKTRKPETLSTLNLSKSTSIDSHLTAHRSEMSTGELLHIEPHELKYIFQLKKQISSSLQLSNQTDEYVAFKVKTTNPTKYCVRPNTGVVLPRSTCDVTVTMQAQKEAPPDMQCKDKFLILSVKVDDGVTPKDITSEMFNKESGHIVEECKLSVVYVAPPQPPSPVAEGSEEGSSPSSSDSVEKGIELIIPLINLVASGFTELLEASEKSAEFDEESGHIVTPPQPPSPVAEGSEEGSSPRGSVSENGNVNGSDSYAKSMSSNSTEEAFNDDTFEGLQLTSGDFMYLGSTNQARNILLKALQDDRYHSIGLFGKRGSGKTALVKAEIPEYENIFHLVVYVTVSEQADIAKLQNQIAHQLNLKLKAVKSKHRRASAIESALLKSVGKVLVIFDDVSTNFGPQDIEDIGIPDPSKQLKILLITHDKKYCNMIRCNPWIPLYPLSDEDAWKLLQQYSSIDNDSPSDLINVAREVAFLCMGLPRVIEDVVSSLHKKDTKHWKETLDCLNHSTASHQIFISFRGKDTRDDFTASLFDALVQGGFKVFKDDEELRSGDQVSEALIKAIEQSRCSIVVLSENYAESSWCLDELVRILKCRKKMKQLVLPIFYKVDPSNVRYLKGSFGEAMTKKKERFKEDRIQEWTSALFEVSDLSGRGYKTGSQIVFIKAIVQYVRENAHRLHIV
ncbi:uncharacterized protein LOC130737297 [Lotus japonicus]|uniref:uncharacterized protein LOC130737297 n=1 Tax=Lotus japonicus TaxID=34305 RepID=UPI00258C4F1F|nr:uncharacterized protein LOC130737297 [Lotus japonicus]